MGCRISYRTNCGVPLDNGFEVLGDRAMSLKTKLANESAKLSEVISQETAKIEDAVKEVFAKLTPAFMDKVKALEARIDVLEAKLKEKGI